MIMIDVSFLFPPLSLEDRTEFNPMHIDIDKI